MKTVLPKTLSPKPGDVSNADYDSSQRMEPWQKTAFLEMLIGGASQHRAATQLGIPRLLILREANLDPQFADDLQLALEARVDAIEEVAVEFATRGVEKGVYHQGFQVDTQREYGAHALLQFLLKGNKPERYKDRSESTLNVQRNEPPPAVRDDRDAQRLLAMMRDELRPVIEGQFTDVTKPTDGNAVEDLL